MTYGPQVNCSGENPRSRPAGRGRLDALAVVHRHDIQVQIPHRGLFHLESPQKQPLHQPPKQPPAREGKRRKKSLDGMGRTQGRRGRLQHPRVARIRLEDVKIREMPGGPIQEKAEQFL